MVFQGVPGDLGKPLLPSEIAWDKVLGRTLFYAGKQYVYGAHLLQQDKERLRQLNRKLRGVKAPPWPKLPKSKATPEQCSAKVKLEQWSGDAARRKGCAGAWWAVVEKHILEALAEDPGMGLGLCVPDDLARMDAVTCGAAKSEVFADFGPGSELFQAYHGDSLAAYSRTAEAPNPANPDMIATVMVAAAKDTGHFGNIPRRFLWAAKTLSSFFVRDVHALSEQAIQRVLSVKAGAGGLDFTLFNKHVLEPLLQGKEPDWEALPPGLEWFGHTPGMKEACQRISGNVYTGKVPAWLRWLRQPSKLGEILVAEGGSFEIPLKDPRAGWLSDEPEVMSG
jgi:hypothetical protein